MDQLTTQLQQLQDRYAERVNLAVAEDREDLVAALSAEFTEACLEILLTAAPPPALPDAA
jgi:hypothetical protein